MSNDTKRDLTNPATATVPASASSSTRKAWEVKFKAAQPAAMPADRLRARAALVRAAMQCGGTC